MLKTIRNRGVNLFDGIEEAVDNAKLGGQLRSPSRFRDENNDDAHGGRRRCGHSRSRMVDPETGKGRAVIPISWKHR